MFSSLFVCVHVSNFAQNSRTDLHEIFSEGWQCANEQIANFCWRSGSPSVRRDYFPVRHYWEIRKVVNVYLLLMLICQMTALVRRPMAEVCTVLVLLVLKRLVGCCYRTS